MIHRIVSDAHQADSVADDPRKGMKNLHCWAEAVYQSSIHVTIFFKGLFSFLK
jgi:hypothetical protein